MLAQGAANYRRALWFKLRHRQGSALCCWALPWPSEQPATAMDRLSGHQEEVAHHQDQDDQIDHGADDRQWRCDDQRMNLWTETGQCPEDVDRRRHDERDKNRQNPPVLHCTQDQERQREKEVTLMDL